jgi:hypothetical protein
LIVAGCALLALATMPGPIRPWFDGERGTTVIGVSPGSEILSYTDAQLAADLDRMVELGAVWIRLDIDWSRIEPTAGDWNWSNADRVVNAARDRGLEVLGLLAYSPAWARPDDSTDKHPPLDPAWFARFASEAAARYAPMGVHTWELWNEPNSHGFWEPGVDPAGYAALVTSAAPAIRAVDPDALVMTGGLAPASDDSPSQLSPERFLRELYRSLEPGTVDAVAVHPYSFPADPADATKSWNLFARLPGLHQLVDDAENRETPIWLTEFGAPFDPDKPQRQAAILDEGVRCAAQWDWTGPVFVYTLRDAPGDGEKQFGIRNADDSERPAWAVLRQFVTTPVGALVTSRCPADNGTGGAS